MRRVSQRHKALILAENVIYSYYIMKKTPETLLPHREHIFSGRFRGTVNRGVKFHARAVAEKTRRRSKKSAAGMSRKATKTSSRASRRPSQSTRAAARSRVSVAKPAPRRKPEPEGATLGMNAKKTTQRQGFKTQEFIVYPAHGVGQIVCDRGAGGRRRAARAVRHQFRQGQDDAAGADLEGGLRRHA